MKQNKDLHWLKTDPFVVRLHTDTTKPQLTLSNPVLTDRFFGGVTGLVGENGESIDVVCCGWSGVSLCWLLGRGNGGAAARASNKPQRVVVLRFHQSCAVHRFVHDCQ